MARSKESIKKHKAAIKYLRWEYARRNKGMLEDYKQLLSFTSNFTSLTTEEIKENRKSKPLINAVVAYIKRWKYSPGLDPNKENPQVYRYRDKRKQLLFQLGHMVEYGFIEGVIPKKKSAIACLTKLPKPGIKGPFIDFIAGKGKVVTVCGDMPLKINIDVDLSFPSEETKHDFDHLIDECKNIIKAQDKLKQKKPRIKETLDDLVVYDEYKKIKSIRKMSKKDSIPENKRRKIQKSLKKAKNLIKGGYKELH